MGGPRGTRPPEKDDLPGLKKGRQGLYVCPYCRKEPTHGRSIMGLDYFICSNPRCRENPHVKSCDSYEGAMASWNRKIRGLVQDLLDGLDPMKQDGRTTMGKKTTTTKVNRDAGTGKFVTEKYTEKHPKTTVTETVKKPTPKNNKK